jgi:hypothetical protein
VHPINSNRRYAWSALLTDLNGLAGNTLSPAGVQEDHANSLDRAGKPFSVCVPVCYLLPAAYYLRSCTGSESIIVLG